MRSRIPFRRVPWKRSTEPVSNERWSLAGERDHTLEPIGDRIELSRERIRQIEPDVIQRLRGLAEEGVLPDGILHDERNECPSRELTREARGQAR